MILGEVEAPRVTVTPFKMAASGATGTSCEAMGDGSAAGDGDGANSDEHGANDGGPAPDGVEPKAAAMAMPQVVATR